MKHVRNTVGAEREAWHLAMQAEVDNRRDNATCSAAVPAELRNLNPRKILPMK